MTDKPRTFVRMFKPQFAPLVRSGQKQQTIRPTPKRMPKVGDLIDCREWEGKPYRSKQRKLLDPQIITEVVRVEIWDYGTWINGRKLTDEEEWALAKADGFDNPYDMRGWFSLTHSLPFMGILISWRTK